MQTVHTLTKLWSILREFVACKRCAALENAAAELLRALEAWRLGPSHEVAAWVRMAEADLKKAMGVER